jgi:hypothetical protein
MNTIIGAQSTEANANYAKSPSFTVAETDSAAYPYQMIADACADAEATVAQAVGQVQNHPWRQYMIGAPALVRLNGAELLGATPIVGVIGYGTVRDPNGVICTERPLEDITRRNRNAGTFFKNAAPFYRIADNRIYHTVAAPGVSIDYFKYDFATTLAAIAGDNVAPLFPSTVVPCYVAGALGMLLKEDEFAATASHYAQLFQQLLGQILTGFTAADPMQPSTPMTGSQIT